MDFRKTLTLLVSLLCVLAHAGAEQTVATRQNFSNPAHKEAVDRARQKLNSPEVLARIKGNRALEALHTQTLNHLQHVSFSFEIAGQGYPHDLVIPGPYPDRPTRIALKKVDDFHKILANPRKATGPPPAINLEREKLLLQEQKELVKKITTDSLTTYEEMRARLAAGGPDASFPEFGPIVEYLELKLASDPTVNKVIDSNPEIGTFRIQTVEQLKRLRSGTSKLPYMQSLDGIERALEFLDVVHRANDPTRSPVLYHSGRYEYYNHFLKAEVPDHITMPTLTSLGATDILKTRGVPIGFLGVNTDITWVDGFYQTPYEFYQHDVNHSRRMFQFFKEHAKERGVSVQELARQSDDFVKKKLLPLISVSKTDDDATKNMKRLRKVLLFEILHEDALPASAEVIEKSVLRPPMLLTPFEQIVDGEKVKYVMEPGATTLAYTYRKLAHDFYDMPGERIENIVAPEFRTRENIVQAAEDVFKALGLKPNRKLLEAYAFTDLGFPSDFRKTVERDIAMRPGDTIPLNEKASAPRVAKPEDITQFFKSRGKRVVTFVGYSALGYEDKPKMLQQARRALQKMDPRTTVINIGATSDGIGSVYQIAKDMGFETSGIVSIKAQKYGALSQFVDQAFYIEDESWGGFVPGTQELSPTSRSMVEASDEIIGIGGGEVASDELLAASRLGKPIQFFPAEMDRKLAIRNATKKGLPAPTNFLGGADAVGRSVGIAPGPSFETYTTTYLTDIEGDWRRLESFAKGNPLVSLTADGKLQLRPGATFVYGGDAIDKGPDSLKVLDALLDLKRRYPDRVVLLAGNRDINKIRLTSELKGVSDRDLPARLQRILADTMGAKEAFEYRRSELAKGLGRIPTDLETAKNFLAEVNAGGRIREYLEKAQLGYRNGNTVYVHGALTDEALDDVEDLNAFLKKTNDWFRAQISDWKTGLARAAGERPGEALIRYQEPIPGTRANSASLVYGRYSDATGNPEMLAPRNIEKMKRWGINRIVVGHTPQSEAVTFLRHPGLEIIIADTSPLPESPQLFFNATATRVRGSMRSLNGKMDFHLPLNADSIVGRRIANTKQVIVGTLEDGRAVGFRVGAGFKPELAAVPDEVASTAVSPAVRTSHLDASEEEWIRRSRFLEPQSGSLMGDLGPAIDEALRLEPGKKPVVIMDLDDTVYDSRYGAVDALRNWLKNNGPISAQSKAVISEYLAKNPQGLPGSNAEEIFSTLGLPEGSNDFKNFDSFFWKWINTPETSARRYPVFPGVKEKLIALQKRGARIVYLTGRKEVPQGAATRSAIRAEGLPLEGDSDVILKSGNIPTPQAKQNAFKKLRGTSKVIAVFDNNPDNLMQMQRVGTDETRFVLVTSKFEQVPAEPANGLYRIGSWSEVGSLEAKPDGLTFDTSARFASESGTYTPQRAKLHEEIVDRLLGDSRVRLPSAGGSEATQNLIFTAGPMGGGKGYVQDRLKQTGFLDSTNYVVVDPDAIKEFIPEYEAFKKIDPLGAATFVHKESGVIAEILLERALAARKNVIVDGSLRAKDYYSGVIDRLRKQHPTANVSILYVDSSLPTLNRRVAERGRETGRLVPPELVALSKTQAADSVQHLRTLADVTIAIDNSEVDPKLSWVFRNGQETRFDRMLENGLQELGGVGKPRLETIASSSTKPESVRGLVNSVGTSFAAIQDRARQAGISSIASDSELDRFMRGRTPIAFSGASKSSWPEIAGQEPRIRQLVQETLLSLDPEKAYLVTGGTNYGFEKIVHEEAQKVAQATGKRFDILGTLTSDAKITEIRARTITHAVVVGPTWESMGPWTLGHVKNAKGSIVFAGGGGVVKNMIETSKSIALDFHLLDGIGQASGTAAASLPDKAFSDGAGLVERLRQKHGEGFAQMRAISMQRVPGSEQKILKVVPVPEVRSPAQIGAYFKARGKKVVTFVGYSGAGYEDKAKMLQQARRMLERMNPKNTIINIGATSDGIGAVYQLAKGMGFETSGIVSIKARQYGGLSPYVDRVMYVEDETWGGFKPGTQELSPTSKAMVESSDQVIGIGGGDVGRDELTAARRMGKPTEFIPAEMNHQLALKAATKKGLPAPTLFKGSAHAGWFAELPVSATRARCVSGTVGAALAR